MASKRNRTARIALIVTAGMLAAAGSARATILTFTNMQSNGQVSNTTITNAYGDNVAAVNTGGWNYLEGNGFTPNVGVTYAGSGVDNRYYTPWGPLGDDAVYVQSFDNGDTTSITFTANAGSGVVVNSFTYIPWDATVNSEHAFNWSISAGGGTVASGSQAASSLETTILTGMTSGDAFSGATVLTITRTGGAGFNSRFAYDDVNFDEVVAVAPTAGVTAGFGVNLVANGDFEIGAASANNTNTVVPGWEDSTTVQDTTSGSDNGGWQLLSYAANFSQTAANNPPGTFGDKYLYLGGGDAGSGNPPGAEVVTQTIDVSSLVFSGSDTFDFSAFLGSFAGQDDTAIVRVEFLDLADAVIGAAVDLTDLDPDAIMMQQSTSGVVPIGTKSIRFSVIEGPQAAGGHDAGIDNISFVITQVGSPAAIPAPAALPAGLALIGLTLAVRGRRR